MTIKVPHLDLPIRIDATTGRFAVVEQDTLAEIANCVEAVVRTRIGQRLEHPQFGIPDLALRRQPLPLDQVVQQIKRWEPRVTVLAEQAPDLLERTLARVQIRISKEG